MSQEEPGKGIKGRRDTDGDIGEIKRRESKLPILDKMECVVSSQGKKKPNELPAYRCKYQDIDKRV